LRKSSTCSALRSVTTSPSRISKLPCLRIQPEPRISATCCREQHDPSIKHYLPPLRRGEVGTHADRCLPVFLHLRRVWSDAAAEVRRLLRVLFVRLGSVPADPGRALGTDRRIALLRRMIQSKHRAIGCEVPAPACWRGGFLGCYHRQLVCPGAASNRRLNRCAHLDGKSVHFGCSTMWTHALPIYRALLPSDDYTGAAQVFSLQIFS